MREHERIDPSELRCIVTTFLAGVVVLVAAALTDLSDVVVVAMVMAQLIGFTACRLAVGNLKAGRASGRVRPAHVDVDWKGPDDPTTKGRRCSGKPTRP